MHLPFRILTAQEAAAMIKHGQTVGFSAFTPAGSAKAIPLAIAERAKTEHAAGRSYQIRVLTGASTGESLDGALASANAISFRAPWQNDKTLRALINSRQVPYLDMYLSSVQQAIRYGFLGSVHWAVIEACDVTAGGGIVLTASVGASEHSVQVVVTEWGVADLRGKDERERARLIINNCAHPDYREELQSYVDAAKEGHPLESLTNAFALHRRFLETGDMRGTHWN